MAANTPFQISTGATVGKSIEIATGATTVTVIATLTMSAYAPALIISNFGPNKAWIRMGTEANPTVSAADHCMLGNTVQLFSNPNSPGNVIIGVMVSVTTSPNFLYVTPGQGSN